MAFPKPHMPAGKLVPERIWSCPVFDGYCDLCMGTVSENWDPKPEFVAEPPPDARGFWLGGFTFWVRGGYLAIIHDASGSGVGLSSEMTTDIVDAIRASRG